MANARALTSASFMLCSFDPLGFAFA